MCTRTVGNLALKHIGKVFIKTKNGFLTFEKAKEVVYDENLLAEKEASNLYQQMEEWDNEAEAIIQTRPSEKSDIDTETINTPSIKSKVNLEMK